MWTKHFQKMDAPSRISHVYTDHPSSGNCPKFVLFDSFEGVKCPNRKICFASLRKRSYGDIPLQFPNLTAFTTDRQGISFGLALCPFGAPPKDTFSHGRPDRLWCPPRKAICPAVHFPQILAILACVPCFVAVSRPQRQRFTVCRPCFLELSGDICCIAPRRIRGAPKGGRRPSINLQMSAR
jgi:hypothetical protein